MRSPRTWPPPRSTKSSPYTDTFGAWRRGRHFLTVDGVVYTVTTQALVGLDPAGSTGNCGSGGGNLQYKAGQRLRHVARHVPLPSPVRADAALAPGTRINDPSYGTILVSVLGADGTGRCGGHCAAWTPESGRRRCCDHRHDRPDRLRRLQLHHSRSSPGKYKIEVEKLRLHRLQSGGRSRRTSQQDIPAGSTFTAGFQYDNAGYVHGEVRRDVDSDPRAIPRPTSRPYFYGGPEAVLDHDARRASLEAAPVHRRATRWSPVTRPSARRPIRRCGPRATSGGSST